MPNEKNISHQEFAESRLKTYSALSEMDLTEVERRVASFMGVDFGVGESKSAVVDIYGSMVHEYRDIGTARVVSPSLYQEIQKAYPIKSMDHILQAMSIPFMDDFFKDLDKFTDFHVNDGPRPHGPQYGWYNKFDKRKW